MEHVYGIKCLIIGDIHDHGIGLATILTERLLMEDCHIVMSGENVQEINKLSFTLNQPAEDIIAYIEAVRGNFRSLPEINLVEEAIDAFDKVCEGYLKDQDNRPWYEKAANKGGKKRKQNYNNRQPWRR